MLSNHVSWITSLITVYLILTQSAYCKHYSFKTALLYIHDHLISAIGSQKVSCLCLLDLSAAFDTIDHDILIMYTTPLSTLISSCSLNHHLYLYTQLFLSFLLTHLDHLHNALDQISSWMTANLLTLNSSKTEFLLIGLSKQLAKISNSSLNTPHPARNLGFILDEHLTFSDQISSVSKSCYYHIRHLRCIRPYLDTKTASTITTSIIHSKLDYCNSLYHNLPNSQITRLQQIQTSLVRACLAE